MSKPFEQVLRSMGSAWRLGKGPIAAGCSASVFAAVVVVLLPSKYTSAAMVKLSAGQSERLSSSLAGLAQKFGLGGSSQAGIGSDYIVALMKSRDVLGAVARRNYPKEAYETADRGSCSEAAASCDLVSIFGKGRPIPGDSLNEAIKTLEHMVTLDVGPRDGIVKVAVEARSPSLAAAIAWQLVKHTDRLNQELQRESGREQRQFAEERLRLAAADLADKERSLEAFDVANREVASSPALRTRRAQLDRAVRLSEAVYVQLRGAVEDALLAEANDVSTLSVAQIPSIPSRRSSPKRFLVIVLAFLVGSSTWFGVRHAGQFRTALIDLLDPGQRGRPGAARP